MPFIEQVNVIDGCYGPYRGAGAPTANVTLLGKAPVGATYMDTTMVRGAGVTPVSTVEQGGEAMPYGRRSKGEAGSTSTDCARLARISRPMMPKHDSGCGRSASS